MFLLVSKIFSRVCLFKLLKVLEKEPKVDLNEFDLIFLETEGWVVVLAGVTQEQLFNSPVERCGFSNELFFLLEGLLELGVLL